MNTSPIWHPFTQHALAGEMINVERGEGAYLHTSGGQRLIDAISSWWVITHGHSHSAIRTAIQSQAEKLDQVIFAGFTHEPAEKLADALINLVPDGLTRVFFSDSGSTAVEVALKMALGYWHNQGATKRKRIVMMENAYHGDTIGAMSIGERGVFNRAYEAMLFKVDTVPFPHKGHEQDTLDALERTLKEAKDEVAALIVEPLVLGAGGMLMYSAQTLREMKRICEAYDVVFIADEVMTGWGRTGTMFACEQAGITPDILCTSKGITGGSLPLAATLCQERFFGAHYSNDRSRTFFHSSSYTANPIACAAAFANTQVWKNEPVQSRIDTIAAAHTGHIERLAKDPRFINPRTSGTIAAIDIRVGDEGYLSEAGPKLYRHFIEHGVLLRPLGNTLYILPPYCVSDTDLEEIYNVISSAPDVLGL